MAAPEATCLECDAVIPAGANRCPTCGIAVVMCTAASCGVPYPAELRFCPFCNTPNPIAAARDPAMPQADATPSLPTAATAPAATAPSVGGAPFSLADLIARTAASTPQQDSAVVPSSSPSPAAPQPVALSALVPDANRLVQAQLPATPLAVPSASLIAAAPLRLDMLVPRAPRKGEQCVARLRATLLAAGGPATLDLLAACDVWPDKQVLLHAVLTPGTAHELPSLKFVPQAAGAEVVRFEATLRGAESLPLGRWLATKDLIVEDAASAATGAITAEKGATVIVNTGGPLGLSNAGLLLPSARTAAWQPIPLQADAAFQLRLKAACPAGPAASSPPIDANRSWPAGTALHVALHAALHIENCHTGQQFAVALVCAASASFGRGGDPAVAWWLLPAPFDAAQHNRLSRRHTALTLRAGRAWVSDHSTNGTSLNRQRVDRAAPELVALGDSLDLAGVMTLRVTELGALHNKVHAVWLDRTDGLAGQLRYLLTDGTVPIAVCAAPDLAPMLWIACLRGTDGAPVLAACAPSERWFAIPAAKTATVGSCRMHWKRIEVPCEQDHYLLG